MLKPVDLYVLTYLATRPPGWTQTSVARALGISQSNVHRALRQLRESQLVAADDTPLARPFHDVLVHAVRHVYPAELGAPARGIPTAHSAPMLNDIVVANQAFVWPCDEGSTLGTAVLPLHDRVPDVARVNPSFYELMALIDVFRLGRIRERREAATRLTRRLEGLP